MAPGNRAFSCPHCIRQPQGRFAPPVAPGRRSKVRPAMPSLFRDCFRLKIGHAFLFQKQDHLIGVKPQHLALDHGVRVAVPLLGIRQHPLPLSVLLAPESGGNKLIPALDLVAVGPGDCCPRAPWRPRSSDRQIWISENEPGFGPRSGSECPCASSRTRIRRPSAPLTPRPVYLRRRVSITAQLEAWPSRAIHSRPRRSRNLILFLPPRIQISSHSDSLV